MNNFFNYNILNQPFLRAELVCSNTTLLLVKLLGHVETLLCSCCWQWWYSQGERSRDEFWPFYGLATTLAMSEIESNSLLISCCSY